MEGATVPMGGGDFPTIGAVPRQPSAIHRSRRTTGTVALVIDGAGRAGTERHVLGLLRGLRALDAKVLLVTSHSGPLVADAVALGVSWCLCPRADPWRYLHGLVRLFRAERPVLVHAHSGRLACLAARLARAPAIVDTRHGIPERLRPLYARYPWLRRWEGAKSRLADRTFCVCEADAAWMEHAGGLPRRCLRVVRNGINVPPGAGTPARRRAARAALGFAPEDTLVAFIGRLAPQKAPLRVLELLRELRGGWRRDGRRRDGRRQGGEPNGSAEPRGEVERDRDSAGKDAAAAAAFLPRAVICGTGPLEPGLRLAEERMGLSGAVVWTGEVEDAGSIAAAADLLLLPSEWEGLPYVILEALAEGIPVLATPVGGVPEVLTGSLAVGCRAWSLDVWVAVARRFLVDARAREQWRADARRSVPGEEATLDGVLAVYRELGWPT